MDFRSQLIREIKALLIWALVPWTGLLMFIKIGWDWYVSGAIDTLRLTQLIVSVVVVPVCGYFARKTYRHWQMQVQAGTTEIGQVVHVSATNDARINVLGLIGAGMLFAVLIIARPVAIASLLILFLAAMIWLVFLSTFMIDVQCVIGTQGLWTAQLGWKIAVPYSAVKHVQVRALPDEQVRLILSGPDIWFGGVVVPIPLDRRTLDFFKNHIPIEMLDTIIA